MPLERLLRPAQLAGLAVLLVSALAMSGLAWRGVALRQQTVLSTEFERRSDQVYHGLMARLELYQAVLRTAAGYWAQFPLSGVGEWRALVQSSRITSRYPGVDGFAYAAAVPGDGVDQFTRDIRRRLWRDFSIHPAAPDVPDHMVITHIEPFDQVSRALGFDLASEPRRRQAVEMARDTGQVTLSSPLTLITGGQTGRDFLLVQPVFRADYPLETVEQRRRAIQGWLLLGLHANALFGALRADVDDPLFDIHVHAGGLNAETLVYGDAELSRKPTLVSQRTLDFAGQRWVVEIHRHLPAGAIWFGGTALAVLVACIGLSLTLTASAALLLVSREQSRRLARHAMTELTRAERALAAVTASVPGVIYRWLEQPAGGGFQFVAPQAGALFGVSPSALVEDWRRLPFLPEDLERWQASLGEAARSALPWEMEGRYLDAQGAVRWWKATATPLAGPEGVVFDGIIVDITELKEAEQVLVERERSYREMFERSSAVMVLLDPLAARIVDTNPAGLAFYGYPLEEMRGMETARISLLDEEGWERLRSRALQGQTDFYRSRHRLASGEVREVEVHAGPVAVSGRTYIHVIVHDVTDRERFQAELQEKTAKLAATNAELEQFSYIASHDLQEPLRTIASFLQLLQRRYDAQLDGEAREFIAFAVDAAVRLQTMIRDLLDYSRIGTRGGAFVPTDMDKELATTRSSLARAIDEAGAEIGGDRLPTVVADKVQMQSLLQNLIGNAIKYRRPDVPPRVQVSATEEEDRWVFRIADNGIGIEPQYFDRIFQVFQRLHSRDRFGGTGIGLALCRKIVQRHGGDIWVESTPGQGSAFLFSIPKR
ncbi:MAG: CHASE domain-containing protein [Magnetospirillum sp.]|nr:CHASE domain-containing protein [Magnetospirillum sp.]